jgi:hypothetical protein
MIAAGEPTPKAAVLGLAGLTSSPAYITQTSAMKLAKTYAQEHLPSGSRTKEAAEHTMKKKALTRLLRDGQQPTEADVTGLRDSDFKSAARDAQTTELGALVSHFTMDQGMKIFEKASPDEKRDLIPILIKRSMTAKDVDPEKMQEYAKMIQDAQ